MERKRSCFFYSGDNIRNSCKVSVIVRGRQRFFNCLCKNRKFKGTNLAFFLVSLKKKALLITATTIFMLMPILCQRGCQQQHQQEEGGNYAVGLVHGSKIQNQNKGNRLLFRLSEFSQVL
jgi:hypothetical protein